MIRLLEGTSPPGVVPEERLRHGLLWNHLSAGLKLLRCEWVSVPVSARMFLV